MLCGLALVPDYGARRRIIEFQGRHLATLEQPRLGEAVNVPHVTVFQSHFDPEGLTRELLLDVLNAGGVPNKPVSMFTWVFRHPGNWVFAHVECPEWLTSLHETAVVRLDDYVLHGDIDPGIDLDDHGGWQAEYYMRYGYRYSWEEFIPHVTLGKPTSCDTLPDSLDADFKATLAGEVVQFSHAAFYVAGEAGSFAETICEVPLL